MTYPIHPVLECFPLMTKEEFQAFKQDIKENGQSESIVIWRNILVDGRHRWRACEELNIEPYCVELSDECDPWV